MPLTAEQLALRRTGITSTDMSAILGLNQYKSPMRVYLEKWGEAEPVEQTEAMYWGTHLEGAIAQRYARENRCYVYHNQGHTLRHPVRKWMMCTPDGGVVPATHPKVLTVWPGPGMRWAQHGLELKTSGSIRQFRRWTPTFVPDEYFVQCDWCMAVCDLDRWDLAALLADPNEGFKYRQYTLKRDPDREAELIKRAEYFRNEYVLPHRTPPPTGLPIDRECLRAMYPADTTPIMPANETTEGLADDLRIAEAEFKDAKLAREALRQKLMKEVGNAQGVEGRNFKITWKRDKRGRRNFRPYFWGKPLPEEANDNDA